MLFNSTLLIEYWWSRC